LLPIFSSSDVSDVDQGMSAEAGTPGVGRRVRRAARIRP